jgi:primosomal protein N' (replication factor Y)
VRVSVAVETPQHTALSAPLDYAAEQAWPPGTLVRVPLGRRTVTGIVWGLPTGELPAGAVLRPIEQALTALPPLPEAWRALVSFAAGYYQRGLGELALAVLPPELRKLDATQLGRRLKRARPAAVAAEGPALRPLTPEQAAALAALEALPPGPVLLHGVTGSGKTELYLRAAARALDAGRQVLVLVPEINLTPQLEARFAERFPGRVLVAQHSGLTPPQRLRHWLQAHHGQADLVLGTRLSVFTPLPRLGLIVVDEEHDPSFKQQDGARYSARDLAVFRGRLENVPVILGSATPSLETWQRALDGRYTKLTLADRVGGGALPRVRIFDMNRLPPDRAGQTVLAPPLLAAIETRIARGEQSLLLLNRRGYAPVLHCGACGWKSGCPHCSAWRVFHKLDRTLRCHHCGFTERVPKACPECGNLDISPVGRGTEKLEEQIAELLPGARVARIDADSTRLKGALESQLAAVHAGDVDVLIGTQMVAKGHDFRRMTLVAAVNPDGALFASDFRAPERLFALLMQAGGRAGRDAAQADASEMWVQTHHPTHPLFTALVRHDYAAFAASQLADRQAVGLPPFSHLALLRAEAKDAEVARAFLQDAAAVPAPAGLSCYEPVPPPVAKVAGVERLQLLVESSSRPLLQQWLAAWVPQLHVLKAQHKGLIRWAVDVDPLGF